MSRPNLFRLFRNSSPPRTDGCGSTGKLMQRRYLLKAPQRRPSRHPRIEHLESRALLAGFAFADFSDVTALNILGSAATTADHRLRLVPARDGIAGVTWYSADQQFVSTDWQTDLQFQMHGGAEGSRSSGFALVIQNFSPTDVGSSAGSSLGYNGLPNSLAIEFDTNMDGDSNDPSQSHISVHSRGTLHNSAREAYSLGFYDTSTSLHLDDGQVHSIRISYTPGTLRVFLNQLETPVLTVPVDLAEMLDLNGGRAWIGFTGTTTANPQNIDILNWSYQPLVDASTTISIDSVSQSEGNSGTTGFEFTITRRGNTSGTTTVNWATADGTALAGTDYTSASGQLTFAPGETQQVVHITANGDVAVEPNESFFVHLRDATGGTIVDYRGEGTILNDETTIAVGDDTVTEDETGYRYVDAFVSANDGGLFHGRGVVFGPDGNAYVGHMGSGAVLRYGGQTGKFIDVFADGRDIIKGTSQILFHQGNLFVAGTTHVLRFDGATGTPLPASGREGALFVAHAEQGAVKGVHALAFGPDGHLYLASQKTDEILKYDGSTGSFLGTFVSSTENGGLSAPNALTFGADGDLYVGASGIDAVLRYQGPHKSSPGAFIDTFVTSGSGGLNWIPSGGLNFGSDKDLYVSSRDTSSILRFDGTTGALVETVVASGEGGLAVAGGFTFDSAGRLYVNSQNTDQVLRYDKATHALFTVSLTQPSAQPVTVDYSTSDGSASQEDYIAASGSVTFAPGETAKTVAVQTRDDLAYEGSEDYFLNLSAPSPGSSIADGQGIGTILDNDPVPTKFYVVNDASADRTYEYDLTGKPVENYALSSGNTAPRGAASNVDGSRIWVADKNKKVFVYDVSGTLQGSWSAGSLASKAQVEGVATDGTDVWIVDNHANKVYRYSDAARLTEGSQNAASSFSLNSGNRNPKGIVTDGTYLWVLQDASTDKVFKYTTSGSLLGSWTISSAGSSPTGLTIDPSGATQHIWTVDVGTDRVYQFDNARSLTSGSLAPSVSFALAAGNTNPQGIADPPTGSPSETPAPPSRVDEGLLKLLAADLTETSTRSPQEKTPEDEALLAVDARAARRASQPTPEHDWYVPQNRFQALAGSATTDNADEVDTVLTALTDDLLTVLTEQ